MEKGLDEIKEPNLDLSKRSTDIKLIKDYISYTDAVKDLVTHAIPSIFGLVCEYLVIVVNAIFVGHLNDSASLGGVGLANGLINILGYSIGMGLNGALDTLVSQAYGDKKYYLGGGYLNRGRIIQTLVLIPQLILLCNTKDILLMFGQDEASSNAAHLYVTHLLPGLFALLQFETTRRYLQAMGVFNLTMVIQGISLLLHCFWCYLLVIVFDLGVIGASISTGFTFWTNLIGVTAYISFKGDVVPKESWHFFNYDSFSGLLLFMKYGVPAALMLCLEWWSYEIVTLFAGMLGVDELAATVVMFNILVIAFQFPFGMSFAACNLIGNSLGDQKPNKAKTYSKVSVSGALGLASTLIIAIVTLRRYVPLIYTHNEDVIELVVDTVPVIGFMVFCDYVQCVLGGSIRAIGYQDFGTVVSLISHCLVMLPMCYGLAFVFNLRYLGLWLGVPSGSFCYSIFLVIMLLRVDWKKVSTLAVERIQQERKEILDEQELSQIML